MRSLYYIYIPIVAALAACESDLELQSGVVQWMEWPAEVVTAKPFPVRLLVPFPACYHWVFKPGVSADQSAVTFAPYFLVRKAAPVCPPTVADVTIALPYPTLDTVGTAPGLAVTTARTFEMRGSAAVYLASPSPSAGGTPVRTFGDVVVRLSNPDTSRRNAAGLVFWRVDNTGCVRIRPLAYVDGGLGFVLEDQADTVGLMYAFARGYFHDAATPVCGQTRVFHLLSRN